MTAPQRHAETILAALQSGPLTTKEIIAATGTSGSYLGNIIKSLLRANQISRVEVTRGRWRYYIGNTAPKQHAEIPPSQVRKRIEYRVPVRHIDMPRFAEFCRNTQASPQMMRVTLPAEPWSRA